ncbi:MAG: hypothetical protein MUC64_17205 [Rubritepida sp.]|nr:hypothetical protein [Rubritepida sp.]
MMRWTALAVALLPTALAAQETRCWVPYAAFEEHVRHFDVERCPGDDPKPEEGFCRMVVEGTSLVVFAFRHDAGGDGPCLVEVRRFEFPAFRERFGLTYRAP